MGEGDGVGRRQQRGAIEAERCPLVDRASVNATTTGARLSLSRIPLATTYRSTVDAQAERLGMVEIATLGRGTSRWSVHARGCLRAGLLKMISPRACSTLTPDHACHARSRLSTVINAELRERSWWTPGDQQ